MPSRLHSGVEMEPQLTHSLLSDMSSRISETERRINPDQRNKKNRRICLQVVLHREVLCFLDIKMTAKTNQFHRVHAGKTNLTILIILFIKCSQNAWIL